MKRAKDPFASRFEQCRHTHVSGRRCGQRVPKGNRYCDLHGDPARYHCAECDSMKQSFIPPKGW